MSAASPSSPSRKLTGEKEAALLRNYRSAPGGETFRRLLEAHLPLVWSTARRLVDGDAQLAEDVTQMVFADFARKAPQLPPDTVAAGWLHRHTCFTARKAVRTEVRRRNRERRAAQIQQDEAMPDASDPFSQTAWLAAAPHLDAALNSLPQSDREALLMRFFHARDHLNIGAALDTSGDTARKRIARALEKLRAALRRRGVLLTAALLSQILTDHASASMAAVPSHIAATLGGGAWRQATATGPIQCAPVSRIRRYFTPVAAVILTACGWWAAARAGWFADGEGRARPASVPEKGDPASTTGTAPNAHVLCTIINLPAKSMRARLLTYRPEADDGALFEETRARAAAEGGLQEFELSTSWGQYQRLTKWHGHDYAVSWAWDAQTGQQLPGDMETNNIGTDLAVTPSLDPSGSVQLVWQIFHHYAGPSTLEWPLPLVEAERHPERVLEADTFHRLRTDGRLGNIAMGAPRLLMSQYLDSGTLPGADPEPRLVLLFATVTTA